MAISGRVAIRSDRASTGAMAQKFGTQPAMLRDRPAAGAAALTGLATLSPTRTARCGHLAQVWRDQLRKAGCPLRAKQRQLSAPTLSPVTAGGHRNSVGTIATSINPSATSRRVGSRGAVHSTDTDGASTRSFSI